MCAISFIRFVPYKQFIASTDQAVGLKREELALSYARGGVTVGVVHTCGGTLVHTGGFAGDEQRLTLFDSVNSFYDELGYTQVLEEIGTLGRIDLLTGCFVAVGVGPFTQFLALVISVPEPAVEDTAEAFIPVGYLSINPAWLFASGGSPVLAGLRSSAPVRRHPASY